MSSLALPREAARSPAQGGKLARRAASHGYEIVLGTPLAMLAAVLLIQLPKAVSVDSWLALVAGRAVWQGGIPQHETLTVLAHGVAWVDQQWLSQLLSYGIYLVGGLALLGLVNVGLLISGVAGATLAGRRLGAPFLSTLIALPMCATMITPSREVRTQEFAIPLFMALAYLLVRDGRSPSRRVFWCLPILTLWANLHGTVTMGAMLVALYGATGLWERRRRLLHHARAWWRPLGLIFGAGVSILLTPYGLAIVGYYHGTMVNSTLRHAVTEWQPVTTTTTTSIALFLVAGIALWSFGRNPAKTTLWEKLAFLVLAASAITVIRNALFFGLFALMILPVSAAVGTPGRALSSGPGARRTRINGTIAMLGVGALALALAVTFMRPDSTIEYYAQRPGVLRAVQRATQTDPTLRVMGDERYTDWLLWRDPALAGRMAYDVRYELLTPGQIQSLESLFAQNSPDWKQVSRGYRLIVLSHRYDPGTFVSMRSEPGARVLYDDGQQMVLLRSAAQAARG
ncbi:MAG: hypothetical protein M3016_03160 [Actinomycetota bacterium]|nr:hypothetical protein [Actinomycetota bacterium]